MSSPVPSRRALLAGVGAVAALGGCTRFTLPEPGGLPAPSEPADGAADGAGVRFTTYASDGARQGGAAYRHEVHTELWLLGEDGERELVHRGRHPEWMRTDLVPGRYELVVVEVSDGERALPPKGRATRRFRVAAGELADVFLTVESFPWEAVVAVLIVVVVIVVIAVVVAGKGNAPSLGGGGGGPGAPRPPGGYSHHGPGIYFVEPTVRILLLPVDVYLYADVWDDADLVERWPPPPSNGPRIDAITPIDAYGTVEIRFTRPVQARDLGPDTLGIHGLGGRVAVGVSVSEDRRVAWVRPLRPLPAGRWTARVLGKAIHDDAGVAIGHDVQVGFDVT